MEVAEGDGVAVSFDDVSPLSGGVAEIGTLVGEGVAEIGTFVGEGLR